MFENILKGITLLDWIGLTLIIAVVLSIHREVKKRKSYHVTLQKVRGETEKGFESISSEIERLKKELTLILEKQKNLAIQNQNDIQSIKMSVNNNETNLEIIKNKNDVEKLPLRSEVKLASGEPVDKVKRAIAIYYKDSPEGIEKAKKEFSKVLDNLDVIKIEGDALLPHIAWLNEGSYVILVAAKPDMDFTGTFDNYNEIHMDSLLSQEKKKVITKHWHDLVRKNGRSKDLLIEYQGDGLIVKLIFKKFF